MNVLKIFSRHLTRLHDAEERKEKSRSHGCSTKRDCLRYPVSCSDQQDVRTRCLLGRERERKRAAGAGAAPDRGTRFQTMFMRLMVLFQFPGFVSGLPSCTRKFMTKKHVMESENEVFANGKEADMFLARRLLYNQFDFEMLTPGNLERECYEEVCNYEEAREIFGEHDKTIAFWKDYILSSERPQKIDAIGLLTGLVAAGVFLVIVAFLGYYFITNRHRSRRHPRSSHIWRNSGSFISRRQDDVSLVPISLPLSVEDSSLPSYDQAISSARAAYDVPPPPYPGITKELKTLKKSLSLPNP